MGATAELCDTKKYSRKLNNNYSVCELNDLLRCVLKTLFFRKTLWYLGGHLTRDSKKNADSKINH